MPVRLSSLVTELESALAAGAHGLARAALLLCRVEAPDFVIDPALVTLMDLGHRAAALVADTEGPVRARLAAINRLLFEVEGLIDSWSGGVLARRQSAGWRRGHDLALSTSFQSC